MRVADIGEFGLIKLLAQELGIVYPPLRGVRQAGLLVGLGDDAVVTQRRDAALIWTTDTLVAGVHFLPGITSWESVGWKALAVNLSDIAAMGGTPDLALVTLTLAPEFAVEDAQALYRGLRAAGDAADVSFGGGDIVRSPVFSITVALSGLAEIPALGLPAVLTRDAARIGDVIAVTGSLGDSAGGLRLLQAGDACDTDATRRLRRAHERPVPQLAAGRQAVRAGVRCAIDVSDGLVQDLGHIATMSGVGIRIDATRVPTSAALREVFPAEAFGLALSGGEDYELVLIAPGVVIEALIGDGLPLTEIGEVVRQDEPGVAVTDETGRAIPLGRHGGWDHLGGR